MDDVLIFIKTIKEHQEITKKVLQRMEENNLYLKPKKCKFCKTKIEYLGIIIEEGRISMDPIKLNGIKDWPTSMTIKQI